MEKNEKKNDLKKKKKVAEPGWATAHFPSLGSRYNLLYRGRHGLGARQGALHDQAGMQWHATTRCSWTATRPARAHDMAQRARHEFLYRDIGFVSRQGGNACLGSAPVVSRYSFCIVT